MSLILNHPQVLGLCFMTLDFYFLFLKKSTFVFVNFHSPLFFKELHSNMTSSRDCETGTWVLKQWPIGLHDLLSVGAQIVGNSKRFLNV